MTVLRALPQPPQPPQPASFLEPHWSWATTAERSGLAGLTLSRMMERNGTLTMGVRGAEWQRIATSVSPSGFRNATLMGGRTAYSFPDGTSVVAEKGILRPWVAKLPRKMENGARAPMLDAVASAMPQGAFPLARNAQDALNGAWIAPWQAIAPTVAADLPWEMFAELVHDLLADDLLGARRPIRTDSLDAPHVLVYGRHMQDGGLSRAAAVLSGTYASSIETLSGPRLQHLTDMLDTALNTPYPFIQWNPDALIGQTWKARTVPGAPIAMQAAVVARIPLDPKRVHATSAHKTLATRAWLERIHA